jgi:putative nucleotidyltransferase with HDIG domain
MTTLATAKPSAPTRRRQAPDRHAPLSSALREEFGVPFRFFDGSTGEVIGSDVAAGKFESGRPESVATILAIAAEGRPTVDFEQGDRYRLALPFRQPQQLPFVAIGHLQALAQTSQKLRLEKDRLQRWLEVVYDRFSAAQTPISTVKPAKTAEGSITPPLKAILELQELLRGMRTRADTGESRLRILKRAASLLSVEAILWVSIGGEESIVIEGDCPLSREDCDRLAARLAQHDDRDSSGCIILNRISANHSWAYFPGLTNLMALAVDESKSIGWLIAINKVDISVQNGNYDPSPHATPESGNGTSELPPAWDRSPAIFRRFDAALLMPFAELLGLESQMTRRSLQVKELFTGLTNSMIAAIDARDSYTYGHSERVARIAVELGRELGLRDDELAELYLGGLLHDIGKIGIRDSILFKLEPLSPEDLEEIRDHVRIGYRILADFQALAHLLPMVLHHHERFDGSGYPHGLKGEAIPLAARILAVADSYDAMNTTRSYRGCLPRAQIEFILQNGKNIQWDGRVIEAFFRVRDTIYKIRQQGIGESVCVAFDNAIR